MVKLTKFTKDRESPMVRVEIDSGVEWKEGGSCKIEARDYLNQEQAVKIMQDLIELYPYDALRIVKDTVNTPDFSLTEPEEGKVKKEEEEEFKPIKPLLDEKMFPEWPHQGNTVACISGIISKIDEMITHINEQRYHKL